MLWPPPSAGFGFFAKGPARGTDRASGGAPWRVCSYSLNIWDVGGQKTLRSYWRNYYEQTDGLIWVVDSADVHRLEDCRRELHGLLREERLAGASLLIMANKQDIEGALTSEEILRALDLEALLKRHWRVAGCSAVSGGGLLDAFDWIVGDIGNRIYLVD